ncbi:MAG: hypothetical protein HYY84_13995 [Deltaproteobacteria bacterium]|nr:hypothetical protein [Deltaproteobacteria bacterium]
MNAVVAVLLLGFAQTVRLQLESEMTLASAPVPGGARCHVRLTDARGFPIAGARLAVRVVDVDAFEPTGDGRQSTNAHGEWDAMCVQGSARQRVQVAFHGDARTRGVVAEVMVDPRQAGGSVSLDAVPRHAPWSDARALRAKISAGLSVAFRVTGATAAAGTLEPITVVSNRAGEAELPIELWRTAPGRYRVEARRIERDGAASAVTSRVVSVTSRVQLLATAEQRASTCAIRGAVRASHGVVANAALTAFIDDEPRHAFASDARGRFDTSFDCPRPRTDSPLVIDLRYQPDREGLLSARSQITATPAAPSPGNVLAISLGAAILLFAAIAGIGRLRASIRRLPSASAPKVDAASDVREPPVVGVTFSPARSILAARTTVVAGVVVDAVTGEPVATAQVIVAATPSAREQQQHAGASNLIHVDERGRFHHDGLGATHLRVSIEAPNYLPSTIDVRLPHRGEYSAMIVSLLSVREAIRDLYAHGSERLGVSLARARRVSPREIVATVETPTASPVVEFASSFDALFFGAGSRASDDRDRFASQVARLPDLAPTERDRLAPLRPVGSADPQKESVEVDGQDA